MAEARQGEVIVLLSAYNGARYIARQIESIRAQSFRDWKLLIRDDCSADDTVEIVRRFCATDPRISLIEDSTSNIGPWASFGRLLSQAYDEGAEYTFLSDQDDVWLEDKMEQQLSLLRAAASKRPLLVHSDLILVDENLQRLHASFSEFQRTSYDNADPLGTLLIHNAVVGCTIAMNRPLLELALPLPPHTLHDWCTACAAAEGRFKEHRIRRCCTDSILRTSSASSTDTSFCATSRGIPCRTQRRRFEASTLESRRRGS